MLRRLAGKTLTVNQNVPVVTLPRNDWCIPNDERHIWPRVHYVPLAIVDAFIQLRHSTFNGVHISRLLMALGFHHIDHLLHIVAYFIDCDDALEMVASFNNVECPFSGDHPQLFFIRQNRA